MAPRLRAFGISVSAPRCRPHRFFLNSTLINILITGRVKKKVMGETRGAEGAETAMPKARSRGAKGVGSGEKVSPSCWVRSGYAPPIITLRHT